MKAILLLTAVAVALSAPTLQGADMSKIPLLGGLFKKKPDTDEIHQMDPYNAADGYDLSYSIPKVVRVVQPRVQTKYAGTQFELKFIVDKAGKPRNIRAVDPNVDAELVYEVIEAVRDWLFAPARDMDGNPVERAVILPINVVAEGQRK